MFICGTLDGLIPISGRRHNTEDIIATVMAVEPHSFIYKGRYVLERRGEGGERGGRRGRGERRKGGGRGGGEGETERGWRERGEREKERGEGGLKDGEREWKPENYLEYRAFGFIYT